MPADTIKIKESFKWEVIDLRKVKAEKGKTEKQNEETDKTNGTYSAR